MTEKIQFIFWCFRKLASFFFDWDAGITPAFAKFRETMRTDPDIAVIAWIMMMVVATVITDGVGLIVGGEKQILGIKPVWIVGVLILIGTVICALFDKFREERQELLDVLKKK